jgi:hypothetical protein
VLGKEATGGNTTENATAYEGVSKSFRTGCLVREPQMVQLSATRCSCIAILWVSLVSSAVITLRVTSQRVFIVVSVYFVTHSVRKVWIHPRGFQMYNCKIITGLNLRKISNTQLFGETANISFPMVTTFRNESVRMCHDTNDFYWKWFKAKL